MQGSPGREGTFARQCFAQTHEPRGTGEALEKGDVARVPIDKRKFATQRHSFKKRIFKKFRPRGGVTLAQAQVKRTPQRGTRSSHTN